MISLALPTYNGERYLEAQLDSIYAQTLVPDEIVVVDDCSTDGTIGILERYRDKYGLKYYINQRNLGYNRNFEKAISLCNGDFIALCDQDDVWLPTKIEKSYKAISVFPQEIPALVSSFCSTDIGILERGKGNVMGGGSWKENLTIHSSQGCTLMINRKLKEVALPFPRELMYDAYLGLTSSLIGNRKYVGEQLMYYRIHQDNSLAKRRRDTTVQIICRNIQKYVPLWYGFDRYKALKYVRMRFDRQIDNNKREYVDKILSMYEVGRIKRMFIFCSIKEVPIKIRLGSAIMLVIKAIFNIKDIN